MTVQSIKTRESRIKVTTSQNNNDQISLSAHCKLATMLLKDLRHIISFSFHNPMKLILLSSPVYRWGN